jgi:hypothetical protein
MLATIPFDWNDPAQKAIVDQYKITGMSGYEGYYPCDFQFYSRHITGIIGGKKYKLDVTPDGNEPARWVSGILENADNPYSAFVSSVKENPKYKF